MSAILSVSFAAPALWGFGYSSAHKSRASSAARPIDNRISYQAVAEVSSENFGLVEGTNLAHREKRKPPVCALCNVVKALLTLRQM